MEPSAWVAVGCADGIKRMTSLSMEMQFMYLLARHKSLKFLDMAMD